jgi:hypothetical protein
MYRFPSLQDLKGDKNPKDFILFFNADFQVNRISFLSPPPLSPPQTRINFLSLYCVIPIHPHQQVLSTSKDNTGDKKYIEGMVFPTLHFPSDHGVTSTVLKVSSPL